MKFLPDEILLMISDLIDSKRDKIRLLSVCQRWRRLFLRKVYGCLRVEEDFDTCDGVAGLAVSLFQNPYLALAVREFDTGKWGMGGGGYMEDVDTAAFHPLLEQIAASLNDLAEWKDRLANNDENIWLTILIILMKNLRVLTMAYVSSDFLYHVMTLVATHQKPFDTNPALQHLEEVRIYTDNFKDSYSAMELIPFAHLPSMKVFKAQAVYEESWPIPSTLKPAPASSGITELHFIGDTCTRCNGSSGFADFIIACKNLRVFEYQHDDCAVVAKRYVEFRPRAFYSPLMTQKHSLEVLRLNNLGDVDPIDPECYEEWVQEIIKNGGRPSDDWFGPLHQFTALRELRIRLRNLLNFGARSTTPTVSFVDILPRSLEYLSIADYNPLDFDVLMANFMAMLACREDKFPFLKKLDIQLLPHYFCYSTDGLRRRNFEPITTFEIPVSVKNSFTPVQEICQKAGIDFSFLQDGEDLQWFL